MLQQVHLIKKVEKKAIPTPDLIQALSFEEYKSVEKRILQQTCLVAPRPTLWGNIVAL